MVPQCFTDLVLVFYLKNTSNHSGTNVSLILSLCFIWKTPAITVVPVFHWSCPSVLSEKHQQSQWYHSVSLILSLCFIWKTPAIIVVPQCFTDLVLVFYLKNTSNHSGTSVSLILSFQCFTDLVLVCYLKNTSNHSGTTVFHWSCPCVLSEKHQQS